MAVRARDGMKGESGISEKWCFLTVPQQFLSKAWINNPSDSINVRVLTCLLFTSLLCLCVCVCVQLSLPSVKQSHRPAPDEDKDGVPTSSAVGSLAAQRLTPRNVSRKIVRKWENAGRSVRVQPPPRTFSGSQAMTERDYYSFFFFPSRKIIHRGGW